MSSSMPRVIQRVTTNCNDQVSNGCTRELGSQQNYLMSSDLFVKNDKQNEGGHVKPTAVQVAVMPTPGFTSWIQLAQQGLSMHSSMHT